MSKIWFKDFTLETLRDIGKDTMLDHIGNDFLHGCTRMNIPCIHVAMPG